MSATFEGLAFVGSVSDPAVLIAIAGTVVLTAAVLFMTYLALGPYVVGSGPSPVQTVGDDAEPASAGAADD